MNLFETISVESSTNSCSSEEEKSTRLNDLPRFPKSASSAHLLAPALQCSRNRSFSSLTPQTRMDERQIISSYVASNLRRSKSSTTYQKNQLSFHEVNEDTRKHKHSQSDAVTSRSNSILASSKNPAPGRESIKSEKGLSRKSSFSYVPSFERTSTNESSVRDVEMNLLNNGNVNQKKRGNRAQEIQRNPSSIKDSNPIARSRDYSLTGTARINLRDSAIDLVSDDENSEAYTAVSLAGTLQGKNSIKPLHSFINFRQHNRKFYVVIAILCGIILLLGGLAVALALLLFR